MAIDPSIPLGVKQFNLGDIYQQSQGLQMRQMQMDDYRRKQEQQSKLSQMLPGAMNGDQQALDGMAGADPDMYMRVRKFLAESGDANGERTKKKYEAAAPLLVRMKTVPYEARRAFLQQAAPVLMANGWTAEELQNFDPTDQAVDSLGTAMMKVGQVLDSQKISWHPIGENGAFATNAMGDPVGAGNPFASGSQMAPPQDTPAGSPLSPSPQASARPPGKTDDELMAQAHEAVRKGANVEQVFRRLQSWGVNP